MISAPTQPRTPSTEFSARHQKRAHARPARPLPEPRRYDTEVVAIAFAPKIIAQWQVNVGALHQTYGELAPDDKYMPRAVAMQRARQNFENVLKWQPQNSVANRRLGMMALDDENFELAVAYLETAYRHEAHNQPTLKALGYAYLWTGKFDRATELFQQVIFRSRLVDELHYYHWYWGTRHQDELAQWAQQMGNTLKK